MSYRKISYSPLWHILIDRQLPKTYLCANDTNYHITTASLAKLSRDESVSVKTLLKICNILNVDIEDICTTATYSAFEDSKI